MLTLGLFEFLELGLDELHLVSVAFLVLSDLLFKLFDGQLCLFLDLLLFLSDSLHSCFFVHLIE